MHINKYLLKIEELSSYKIPGLQFPLGYKKRLSSLLLNLDEINEDECELVLRTLDLKIHQIADDWVKNKVSNYTIFGLKKLRQKTQNRIRFIKTFAPKQLIKSDLVRQIELFSKQGMNMRFPDSARAFLDYARRSKYFVEQNKDVAWIPPTVPILFLLNPGIFFQKGQSINIVSGHCLIGMEPNEEFSNSVHMNLKFGLMAQDCFLYSHVEAIRRNLINSSIDASVKIFLDIQYYEDKLIARSRGTVDKSRRDKLYAP